MQKIATFYRSTPEIDKAEQMLLEQLRELDRRYKAEAKPIVDRLAQLHEMKVPIVTIINE